MIDYKTPSPDEGHEAIRAPLAQAIDDLAANTLSVGDAMMLINGLANLAGTLGAAIPAAETAHAALRQADADEATRAKAAEQTLAARAAKLEALQLRGTTGTATSSSLLAAGNTNLTVPLKTAMPDANYVALALVDATAGINLSNVSVAVIARTTTAVTVQIKNSGLGLGQTVTVQVLAISLL